MSPTPNLVCHFAGLNAYVDNGKGCLQVLMLAGHHGEVHTPRVVFLDKNYLSPSAPGHHTIETPDGKAWGIWDFRGIVTALPGGKPIQKSDHVTSALEVPDLDQIVSGCGPVRADYLGSTLPIEIAARLDVQTGTSTADPIGKKDLEFINPATGKVVKKKAKYATRVKTTMPLKKDAKGLWSVVLASPGYLLKLFTTSPLKDIEVTVTNLPQFPEKDEHFAGIWSLVTTVPADRPIPRVPSSAGGQAGCVGGQ